MPITNYKETSCSATEQLRTAIKHGRRSNWSEAIFAYKRLLCSIEPRSLPQTFSPTDTYRLILYETYYNLGCAHQRIGDHTLAVKSFSKALDDLAIAKFGCTEVCRSTTMLAVPVHCKRAVSQSLLGNYKSAMRDVTSEYIGKNMDVLCLEALIHNTFGHYDKAMKLLANELSENKTHVGCQMLRSWMKEEGHSPKFGEWNEDKPDEVTTLCNPNALEFMDRFLHTLSIPHSVDSVSLFSSSPCSTQLTESHRDSVESIPPPEAEPVPEEVRTVITKQPVKPGTPRCYYCANKEKKPSAQTRLLESNSGLTWKRRPMSSIHPFKCGALPALFERDPVRQEKSHVDKHRRRAEYGHALREFSNQMRMVTQDEFIAMLEETQSRKKIGELKMKKELGIGSAKITLSTFPTVNTDNVPRHYVRPWRGDRLQSAPLFIRERQPIFYPSYS